MLVRLIYASKVASHVDYREVKNILAASQRNNTPRGVSGLLIFNSGYFLQWLEGGRAAVSERFTRILGDDRHTNPLLLDYQEVTRRQFTEWNMGYLGEGPMNRSIFFEFGQEDRFDPYTLSGASAEAMMLAAKEHIPLLKS